MSKIPLLHRIGGEGWDEGVGDSLKTSQHPIEPSVVDFICIDAKLIIEIDGGQHYEHMRYDAQRTHFLESRGFKVLRFWNIEVMNNMEGVLVAIIRALVDHDSTTHAHKYLFRYSTQQHIRPVQP